MNVSWSDEYEEYENLWPFMFNNTYRYNQNGTLDSDYDELYEVPTGIIVLLSICYGTISVLAIVGNSLVMWVIATSKRMQNVTNYFIANLALADIVIGLFVIPFQFQAALLQRWNLPHFMCAFCPFVQILSVNVSVFTLTAIAVDRHRAILKPLSAQPGKLKAKIIIAGIWLLGGCLAVPMATALRVVRVPEYTANGWQWKPFCKNKNMDENAMLTYRALLGFLQYLTPLSIISCVYTRMVLKLWGNRAPGNAEDARDANLMRNKKKAIKMLVIVVALFGICWLPLQMYNVLQYTFPQINEYRYINIIWFSCDWLAMSNSFYNPFIYGIYNEKFKKEFQERCPLKTCNWSNSSVDNAEQNRTPSARTSVRFQWRQSGAIGYPAIASFYRAVSVKGSSNSSKNNRDSRNSKKNVTAHFDRNSHNNHSSIQQSERSEELYVFPSNKRKYAHDFVTEELGF